MFSNVKFTFNILIDSVIDVAIGILIYYVLKHIITSIFNRHAKRYKERGHRQKKLSTARALVISVVRYIIIALVILSVLMNIGIDVKSILAGIGVTAIIVGLAFQDLAKDILAGIYIILEDQFELGDVVTINGFKGEVIDMTLRTTRIKKYNGEVLIIPNHNITSVINYNLEKSLAEISIPVVEKEDTDKVIEVLSNLCERINKDKSIEDLEGDLELIGIVDFDDSSKVYQLRGLTKSTKNYEVERKIRKEIAKEFEKNKIKRAIDYGK